MTRREYYTKPRPGWADEVCQCIDLAAYFRRHGDRAFAAEWLNRAATYRRGFRPLGYSVVRHGGEIA